MNNILETLEQDMASFSIGRVTPLACDKWIASSAMQKSIRRGNVKLSLRAGFTLWQQDRASFWRRVHSIALEDVGVSAPDTVVKVLTAYANSAWRVKRNDLLVGLYLITLMCGAVKTRVADEVIAIIGNGLDLKRKREEFFFAENDILAGVVLDKTQSLPERALALWLLAGTCTYPHDNLPTRKGNIALAMDVLSHLSCHTDLTKATFAVLRKTQWTLALLTPLLYQEISEPPQPKQTTIILDDVTDMDDVKGIPLVALDQFTRVGKPVRKGQDLLKGFLDEKFYEPPKLFKPQLSLFGVEADE